MPAVNVRSHLAAVTPAAASAAAVADGWRDGEVEKCGASEEENESPVRCCLLL